VETKKGTDPNILAKKVHGTFEKAQKREYTVMFLVMSTRIGNVGKLHQIPQQPEDFAKSCLTCTDICI
jgi:hypothetical protein